jgi:hypothetical protein
MGLAQHLANYALILVILTGAVGNLVAFAVCSQTKLKPTVFSIYIRFRILVDTLNLLNGLNLFLKNEFDFWIERFSIDLCRLATFLSYIPATSGWIDVFISIDRWISIKFPHRFLILKKSWLQIAVCFGFLIKDFLIYGQIYLSHMRTTFSYENSTNQTWIKNTECASIDGDLLHLMDLWNANLPFIFMFIFTLLILKCLYDSKRNLSSNNHSAKKRQRKFAVTIIGINIVFFITVTPLSVFYSVCTDTRTPNFIFIKTILLTIFLINYGSSFYINVAVNSLFREEFFNLFCCRNLANANTRSSTYRTR